MKKLITLALLASLSLADTYKCITQNNTILSINISKKSLAVIANDGIIMMHETLVEDGIRVFTGQYNGEKIFATVPVHAGKVFDLYSGTEYHLVANKCYK